MIVEIILAVGGGILVIQDWRKGFPVSKGIYRLVSDKVHGTRDSVSLKPVEIADKIVTAYAKAVAELKESVAQVIAHQRVMLDGVQDQRILAEEAQVILDNALRKGDEEIAELAATKKINHEQRARMFSENAEKQEVVAKKLQLELNLMGNRLENVRTTAETIKVRAHIALVNQQLHNLLSDVSKTTGLSFQGQLEDLALTTQTDQYRTEALLVLDSGNKKITEFQVSARARKEIEAARDRIAALPEHSQDSS